MEQEIGGLDDVDEHRLFRCFVEFVDVRNVEPRVRSFLERQGGAELKASFGNPEASVDPRDPDAECDFMTKTEALKLSQDIRDLFETANWKKVITSAAVSQEAEHARTELVRHWLDTLLLAFEIGQVRRELCINRAFQPVDPLEENDPDWQEALQESRRAMLGNVALSSDDVSELQNEYFDVLCQRIGEGPVAIPGGFEFASNRGVVLRRAGLN